MHTSPLRSLPPILSLIVTALSTAACMPYGCIARGMRVLTPKGLRRIEQIEVGDEVYCVDPDTGEHIAAKVSRITRAMRECGRLHMADGSALMLTSCHPVYDPESGEYVHAGDWMTGQRTQLLATADQGVEQVRVTQVEVFAALSEVFDLTVDHQLHNFVVEGILVHNKSVECIDCGDPCQSVATSRDYQIIDMMIGSTSLIEEDGFEVIGMCGWYQNNYYEDDPLGVRFHAEQTGETGVLIEKENGEREAIWFSVEQAHEVFLDPIEPEGLMWEAPRQISVKQNTDYTFNFTILDDQGDLLQTAGVPPDQHPWKMSVMPIDSDATTLVVDPDKPQLTISIRALQNRAELLTLEDAPILIMEPE